MVEQDWLGGYLQLAGVKHAVDRIALRLTSSGDRLRECWTDLERNYDVLATGFDQFFPQLSAFVASQRETQSREFGLWPRPIPPSPEHGGCSRQKADVVMASTASDEDLN